MIKQLVKKVTANLGYQTDKKQVLILSDDWGSVRIRSLKDREALADKGLLLNNRFDLYDSLETNYDLELLFEVLTRHKDCHGNHPIISPVTNVGNPDFKKIKESNFQNYYFETIRETYQRYPNSDRVLSLTHEGIQNKIFIPQSHGREHVQVNWWLQELQHNNSYAQKFFDHEFFLLGLAYLANPKRNRGISASFDIWDNTDLESTQLIARSSLQLFEVLYGYKSSIFTPPAIFYSPTIEPLLREEEVDWIDVGRYFKAPGLKGKDAFQFNYLGREKKSGLKVLVRNCMFETNMNAADDGVSRCLFDIEQAFALKQPAIISNHRASFVGGIDEKNRSNGLKALDSLLSEILKKWPDVEFVTITDLKFKT